MNRSEAIEAAARALVDALKWEDELMSYVLTRNATLSALRQALAPRSERREGEPADCPDCNDGILTRAFAEPHDIPCPTCNGTMLAPPAAPRWVKTMENRVDAPAAPKEEA